MNRAATRSGVAALLLWAGAAAAQQVQPGHYAPGFNGGLRTGILPVDPGVYLANTAYFYDAREQRDGDGDKVPDSSRTDYILNALSIVGRPDFELFGGDYAAIVAPALGNLSGVPVLDSDGNPQDPPGGFADLFFSPLTLGWHWDDLNRGDEFHLVGSLSGFAPTGKYSFGSDDNVGLGFWTFMPYVAGTYRTDRGIFESFPFLLTGALRYEIHSEQQGRDFRPGDSFTFEWGVGLEVAERTDVGIVGFVYRQATDATGRDAQSVDKYQSNGIGATLAHSIGPVSLALRAYQDFGVINGPDGTAIYLDVVVGFPFSSGQSTDS